MWGKILGFCFGFMFGRLFGAILGLYIGHLFDKSLKNDFEKAGGFSNLFKGDDVNERQALFFSSCFAVMGHIAKSNGRVSEVHIKAASLFMDEMGLKGDERREAQYAFSSGKGRDFSLKETVSDFKERFAKRHDLMQLFLEIQIQVAFADGNLDKDEREALHQIANGLGYSAKELDKLLEMIIAGANFHQHGQAGGNNSFAQSGQQLANAYKVLGVTEQDSASDIKKAYRKLMSQHHPDKLVAKGLPPEMMEMAKQKAQDIQAAYELISAQNK